jgi:hypothetical protein
MNASRAVIVPVLLTALLSPVRGDASSAQTTPAAKPQAPKASAQTPKPTGTAGAGVNARAAALADFKARLEKYLAVKKQAAKGQVKLKESREPAEIVKAQETLAARVRALRADAKPGEIITPAVRAEFRRLLYPETKGEDGRDARAVLEVDAPPPGKVPLRINAKYPEGTPLPSVPSNFLLSLPTLPDSLEYRIIDKDLILLDIDANIVVDYMPNVIR